MKYTMILLFGLFALATLSNCNKKSIPVSGDGFSSLNTKMELNGFSKECKKFIKKEIRMKWKLHESKECFYNDQPFWESILGKQECFVGKPRRQIETIFGKPQKVNTSTKQKSINCKYYMGKTCEKNSSYFNLQFIYDENEKLIKIGQGQLIVDE